MSMGANRRFRFAEYWFVNVDFRPREPLCGAGLTFFVSLLASEISFVSLDRSPNKNSDDDGPFVALHKAA